MLIDFPRDEIKKVMVERQVEFCKRIKQKQYNLSNTMASALAQTLDKINKGESLIPEQMVFDFYESE